MKFIHTYLAVYDWKYNATHGNKKKLPYRLKLVLVKQEEFWKRYAIKLMFSVSYLRNY